MRSCLSVINPPTLARHWLAGLGAALLTLAVGGVAAKLPPPQLTDEQKLKAAETAAKTAWSGKVAEYQLCRAQDEVAARYHAAVKAGTVKPVGSATASASTPMSAASAPATGQTAAPVSAPVAVPVSLASCADPGPFAFTPPAPKPLEAAGAHSPPETAKGPPNTKTPAAETAAPAKKP